MGSEHADGAPPQVSVIVVTHNNEAFIADCLQSVDDAAASTSCELVVVDNGSRDGTSAIVRDHPSKPRLVELAENAGFAAATNAGIRESSGRLIALVNSDAFPDPRSIDQLVAAIDALPGAGIVGGRLRYPDGHLQPSYGRFPSLLGGLWVALFLHRAPLAARIGLGISAHPALYRRRRRVEWVTAAFCIARRSAGALPERGFMYGEDVEWAFAAQQAGLEVWFDPAATAVHVGHGSVDRSQSRGFAQCKRAEFELAWYAHAGRLSRLAARGVLAVHALLRMFLFAAVGLLSRRHSRAAAEYFALLKAALSSQSVGSAGGGNARPMH